MNALEDELRAMIALDGPISVERYMQLCLQHPRHGYYTTRESIGRDFVTAPEVDQMFGELVGLWAAQTWYDCGAPPLLRLVELGPGRGTLMADALRATRIVPGFHDAVRVHLVETSPRLREAQRERLADVSLPVAWHAGADEIPAGPAIVVANEFFDALPVRHYLRGAKGWHERMVGFGADGRLRFGAAPDVIDDASLPVAGVAAGAILEVAHAAGRCMSALARRVAEQGGAILVCDYGHARSGLGETLQAMRAHAFVDVLDAPGEADLTVHVDFAALARIAAAAGAAAHGPIEQGLFLRRLGLAHRAEALMRRATPEQAASIRAAVERFTAPTSSMATLFKALAVVASGAPAPAGFVSMPQGEVGDA